jgi:deazaflavin-dependent oxidoreductase (nitroreductase family)
MELPSPARLLVESQKLVTRVHRSVLQSPLGGLLARLPGAPFLVLHTTGRKSGQPRQSPLSFTRDGAAYVVIASNGGAPRDPDWYLNLQGRPTAEIEVGGRRTPVRAETVEGPDRDRLWAQAVRSYAGYVGYQARASRQIPVVRLIPVTVPLT